MLQPQFFLQIITDMRQFGKLVKKVKLLRLFVNIVKRYDEDIE